MGVFVIVSLAGGALLVGGAPVSLWNCTFVGNSVTQVGTGGSFTGGPVCAGGLTRAGGGGGGGGVCFASDGGAAAALVVLGVPVAFD